MEHRHDVDRQPVGEGDRHAPNTGVDVVVSDPLAATPRAGARPSSRRVLVIALRAFGPGCRRVLRPAEAALVVEVARSGRVSRETSASTATFSRTRGARREGFDLGERQRLVAVVKVSVSEVGADDLIDEPACRSQVCLLRTWPALSTTLGHAGPRGAGQPFAARRSASDMQPSEADPTPTSVPPRLRLARTRAGPPPSRRGAATVVDELLRDAMAALRRTRNLPEVAIVPEHDLKVHSSAPVAFAR